MIILGVDPGTATTGYGIIKLNKKTKEIRCVDYGCIYTKQAETAADRLYKLYKQMRFLIKKYKPKAMAVENVYFFKNLKTAMPVSQAKGVVILTAAKNKLPVFEYTPLQVKLAITGYGAADKQQIQRMIQAILKLNQPPKPDDAADALGIAICHIKSINLSKDKTNS